MRQVAKQEFERLQDTYPTGAKFVWSNHDVYKTAAMTGMYAINGRYKNGMELQCRFFAKVLDNDSAEQIIHTVRHEYAHAMHRCDLKQHHCLRWAELAVFLGCHEAIYEVYDLKDCGHPLMFSN